MTKKGIYNFEFKIKALFKKDAMKIQVSNECQVLILPAGVTWEMFADTLLTQTHEALLERLKEMEKTFDEASNVMGSN